MASVEETYVLRASSCSMMVDALGDTVMQVNTEESARSRLCGCGIEIPSSNLSIKEALDFVASGLEDNYEYKASNGESMQSSSYMTYSVVSGGNDAILYVKVVRSDPDCIYTFTSRVQLSELDPNEIHGKDQPWGIFLSAGSTDGKRVVREANTVQSRRTDECVANDLADDNELRLRFDDPRYRDRAIKALRHAIRLAGGKVSAF